MEESEEVRSTDIRHGPGGDSGHLRRSFGGAAVLLYNSWLQQMLTFQAALKLVLGQLAGYPLLLFYRYHPIPQTLF